MAFNFSALQERARMSTEERVAHEESQRRSLSDRRFKYKSIREESVQLSSDIRFDVTGDVRIIGATGKGIVEVLMCSLRFERDEILALRDHICTMVNTRVGSGVDVGEWDGIITVQASGFFSSRDWNDLNGKRHKRWIFTVARLDYRNDAGETVVIGWDPASD